MHPRRYPSIATAITALIAQACGLVTANHELPSGGAGLAGSGGQSSGGTSPGTGGVAAASGNAAGGSLVAIPIEESCFLVGSHFEDQVVDAIGAQRVFYSWTTDEQVAELREGAKLFSRSERAGMGRGLLFNELADFAAAPSNPQGTLAATLVNDTFAKARFAWTNPWATLLGFPGESYGNQLLRIELRPEAWIARFGQEGLYVFDANGKVVAIEMALASPERIGAIFYQSEAEAGACGSGTFAQGGVGFREFALGNIAMVSRWSLATAEISQRLESDIQALQSFHDSLNCIADTSRWSNDLPCKWGQGYSNVDVLANYDFALCLPSELYRPSAMNIEALIAALEASLPTGDPLDVILPNSVEIIDKNRALAQLAEHKQRLLAGSPGCVMCALAQGRADLPFIAENQHAVVLLDRFACRYGHLMVIPRVHVEHLSQLPWEVFSDVQRLTFESAQAIDACLKPARVFTATLGAAVELPMTYSHYHMHVIPVFETDERARPARVLSWSEGVVVYDDAEAHQICHELSLHWPGARARDASGFG